ncbi:MAG: YqcC family protein [Halothiobacillaceae bacterium]
MQARLAAGLDEIEAAMKTVGFWSSEPPEPEALASMMPFCHDTLFFHEWLQWVFLPRMRALLESDERPPMVAHIHPMAEHSFAERPEDTAGLEAAIARFDALAVEWHESR